MSEALRLACIDSDAPPLFGPMDADGRREGFEPDVAGLVADLTGRPYAWMPMPWEEMLPAVAAHRADAVLCGQGITPSRAEVVAFTRPYAVFHESVLVRRGSGICEAEGLRGKRVAAIAGSTNIALATTFDGADVVPFAGGSGDVYADMLDALSSRRVDAVVDDDVVFVPLGAEHPDFEVAFTVRTGNRWGIGVAKDRPRLAADVDAALGEAIRDRAHAEAWQRWLPSLEYPFAGGGGS